MLRGDQKSRYEAYAIGRQWGWLSANDIRRLENMPPVTGGDIYMQPLNMVDAGKSGADLTNSCGARNSKCSTHKLRGFWRNENYLRASSLLFNQPLLVMPDMLDLGVRWANQVMSLNIVNIGGQGTPGLWSDDGMDRIAQREEERRTAIARTGIEVIPVSGCWSVAAATSACAKR